ncbi:MAG: hypothetical protein ACI9YB_001124 [Halioglobus sp.]|jgi:hypothetical protein
MNQARFPTQDHGAVDPSSAWDTDVWTTRRPCGHSGTERTDVEHRASYTFDNALKDITHFTGTISSNLEKFSDRATELGNSLQESYDLNARELVETDLPKHTLEFMTSVAERLSQTGEFLSEANKDLGEQWGEISGDYESKTLTERMSTGLSDLASQAATGISDIASTCFEQLADSCSGVSPESLREHDFTALPSTRIIQARSTPGKVKHAWGNFHQSNDFTRAVKDLSIFPQPKLPTKEPLSMPSAYASTAQEGSFEVDLFADILDQGRNLFQNIGVVSPLYHHEPPRPILAHRPPFMEPRPVIHAQPLFHAPFLGLQHTPNYQIPPNPPFMEPRPVIHAQPLFHVPSWGLQHTPNYQIPPNPPFMEPRPVIHAQPLFHAPFLGLQHTPYHQAPPNPPFMRSPPIPQGNLFADITNQGNSFFQNLRLFEPDPVQIPRHAIPSHQTPSVAIQRESKPLDREKVRTLTNLLKSEEEAIKIVRFIEEHGNLIKPGEFVARNSLLNRDIFTPPRSLTRLATGEWIVHLRSKTGGKRLGSGTFKTFKHALNYQTGQIVASGTGSAQSTKEEEDVLEEAKIGSRLRGKRGIVGSHTAVQYFSKSRNKKKIGVISELYNGGELNAYIPALAKNPIPTMSQREKGKVVMDALHGLKALHDEGTYHRDIKPANILVHRDPNTGQVKGGITDFGLACPVNPPWNETFLQKQSRIKVGGTPGYIPPEHFNGPSSTKGDIYAMGLTLYEFYTGDSTPCINIQTRGMPPLFPDTPIGRLAQSCMQPDPNRRPDINQLINEFSRCMQYEGVHVA